MDVTSDATSVDLQGLNMMIPFLLFGYGFQIYNGYVLYTLHRNLPQFEWQVFLSSIVFVLLGVGNTTATVVTYVYKLAKRKEATPRPSPNRFAKVGASPKM